MSLIQPLNAGNKAPDFSFISKGKDMNINALGSYSLIYFYPKDDTPGCTKEACGLRDAWSDLQRAGLKVFGVSGDSEKSHDKFIKKYSLPFSLIADTDLTLARAFGVYGEKKFMGKTYEGIHRMSFLLNPKGHVLKTYFKVKPEQHANEVLEDFAKLDEL
jgi:peroxiredoxin Q/BCP